MNNDDLLALLETCIECDYSYSESIKEIRNTSGLDLRSAADFVTYRAKQFKEKYPNALIYLSDNLKY